MDQQALRDALCKVEDDARELRARVNIHDDEHKAALYSLIARLTQLVREEIVR